MNLKSKIIVAVLAVGVLGYIGQLIEGTQESPKAKSSNCNIQFDDFAIRGEGEGLKYLYVKVSNYNKNDSTCKQAMYEHFKTKKAIFKTAICVNYLDNIDFDPPKNGLTFGNETIQNKVIAQIVNLKTGKEIFDYDPFDTGKY